MNSEFDNSFFDIWVFLLIYFFIFQVTSCPWSLYYCCLYVPSITTQSGSIFGSFDAKSHQFDPKFSQNYVQLWYCGYEIHHSEHFFSKVSAHNLLQYRIQIKRDSSTLLRIPRSTPSYVANSTSGKNYFFLLFAFFSKSHFFPIQNNFYNVGRSEKPSGKVLLTFHCSNELF